MTRLSRAEPGQTAIESCKERLFCPVCSAKGCLKSLPIPPPPFPGPDMLSLCRSYAVLACAILALSLSSPVSARAAPDSFADLADKLLPTVVNISTSQTLKAPSQSAMPQLPPGSPLEDLFKNFLGPKPNAPRHVTSLGSGFIIDPSGYIVTNNHVIENGEQITEIFSEQIIIPAGLVGRGVHTDL